MRTCNHCYSTNIDNDEMICQDCGYANFNTDGKTLTEYFEELVTPEYIEQEVEP